MNRSDESIRKSSPDEATEEISGLVKNYFDGLYFADVEKLKAIFHEDVVLKAPGLRRSREEWLEAVASRPIPSELGHEYNFELLAIEVVGQQAMVKVKCPLYDYSYVDFLGFLYENGQWQIVNKMYVDLSNHL